MSQFADLVHQSAAHAWLFIPSAILLGALHGLEPGHSKTMMAAFIVAVRGTVTQAVLLAIAATVSHTALVWAFALLALTYGSHWNAETSEPYFQILSGVIITGMALWMLYRTWREQQRNTLNAGGQTHHHDHHDETKRIDTGHGVVELSVYEEGVPPRFRLHYVGRGGSPVEPATGETVTVETLRDDGTRQSFSLANKGTYLESESEIPEPHEFTATLSIGHAGHVHRYETRFEEHDHAPAHKHGALGPEGLDAADAHQRAHAREINERFAGGTATMGQVVLFGLTGGLLPCPAAVTVLLLCLQLQRFWLGIVLVLCFSIGLALTLMMSGVAAAWGTQHLLGRWKGFDALAQRAPYVASLLIVCVGLYVGMSGVLSL